MIIFPIPISTKYSNPEILDFLLAMKKKVNLGGEK